MLSLCVWIAEYYVAPLGVVIRSALPASLASPAAPEPSRRTRRVVAIRDDLPSLLEREKTFARKPQQRALFELIESIGGPRAGRASHRAAQVLAGGPADVGEARVGDAGRRDGVARSVRPSRDAGGEGARSLAGAARRARDARRAARAETSFSFTASPAAVRRSSTSSSSSVSSCAMERRRSCSCPRSRSRRRPSIAFAPSSATRWPCCTARSATASGTTNGSRCAKGASESPSERDRRSSPRSPTSARSSSTRSTSRATSRAKRRGITRARLRSCARDAKARWWCSGARRRAWRVGRTRRAARTR